MSDTGLPSFVVRVGKATLRVASRRQDLIEELQKRYAGFVTDSSPQMDVIVRPIQHNTPTGLLNVKPVFTGKRVAINTPSYQGVVDVEQGLSEIFLPVQRLAEDTEYFLRMVAALMIFDSGGLMFHAAGIASKHQVYVFFGHSGSGKTTVAKNSPGKQALNDDLIVLERERGEWRVYSTPFWNPTQVKPLCLSGKLHALYQLVQDKEVALQPVTPGLALAEFLANVPVINSDASRGEALLERCLAIISSVPVYRLHFLPDETFWNVVK